MSLAWLRNHARNRNRGTIRHRSNNQRLAAQRAHRQFAGAEAYAPRVTYDTSFVVDSSVVSQDVVWTSDDQYKRQYLRLGWEVAPIRKDGNCLFRSLSDQLYGHERRHLELRRRLVDYINLERAFFEPFVAGEGVVEYCARLREAGAWGGHPELIAASRLLGVNIVVHTGPVKRLRIDTDKHATSKEGKGQTLNLLLKHDHYSSLRKRDIPLDQQHGCSDMCLCRRIVTPSRASLDCRASIGARSSDLGLSLIDHQSLDLDVRNSLEARSADIEPEKHGRVSRDKGAYGRKSVPDADTCNNEKSTVRKKVRKIPAKPKSRPPPPPITSKTPALAPPCHSVSAKPKEPAPAPPAESKPAVYTPTSKSKTVASLAPVPSTTPQPSGVQRNAVSPRTTAKSAMVPLAEKSKSPGVVLFQPESLKSVKPKTPLVMLFEPEQAPISKPTPSSMSKKTTANTATPVKPTSATVLEVDVEGPETMSGEHTKIPQRAVRLPRRAVFNGGKRRRSSAAALSLLQEVTTSLNTTTPEVASTKVEPMASIVKPVTIVEAVVTANPVSAAFVPVEAAEPKPPAPRSMEIKKSSKKVFRQGRPVATH